LKRWSQDIIEVWKLQMHGGRIEAVVEIKWGIEKVVHMVLVQRTISEI